MTSPPTHVRPSVPPPPPATHVAIGRLVSPRWATRLGVWVTVDRRDRMRWSSVLCGIIAAVALISATVGRVPYTIPKPLHDVGVVSPTAGLTRGTSAITHGHFALAFHYHPLSFLVVLLVLGSVVRVLWGVSGPDRWVNVRFHPSRAVWIGLAVALVIDWAYQQAHASFLIHTHLV